MEEKILEKYIDKGFSKEQLEEISLGIEADIDVSMYARLNIKAPDMAYIRKKLFFNKVESKDLNINPKEDNFKKLNEDFKEYQEAIQTSLSEKAIVFAMTMASLSVVLGMIEIIIVISKL